MNLKRISADFSVCRLSGPADLISLDGKSGFWFLGKTDEELSLVCETSAVPENAEEREDGFSAFRIEGVLDFSLIGILSKISTILADHGIGIFAVSTFNTDYILVKKENYEKALRQLEAAGYTIIGAGEEA
ncbi:ACT domain-containing protein [Clostridium sp. Marseille-P2415]|uniref:ACT domain-containing protein n=1 Tax=Clostridium sp. Marseille-P2415 TaxID=1805471 RepID=UPI000988516F|nr:ACT domain-containing protein [Clostridium sp. Marseille-P2415]